MFLVFGVRFGQFGRYEHPVGFPRDDLWNALVDGNAYSVIAPQFSMMRIEQKETKESRDFEVEEATKLSKMLRQFELKDLGTFEELDRILKLQSFI